jgi:diguanylate cyclase (GGDEF)-like protein
MNDKISTYISSGIILEKISDITRIVDPLQKKVISFKENNISIKEVKCFDFWDKDQVCENCISMRAYNDNTSYVKIEYNEDKMFMVTAFPYNISGNKVIVEVLKDITNSMFLESSEMPGIERSGVNALIDNMNKLAFIDPLTGVYNRRYILEKLPVDILNSTLLSREISIIMVDLDFFKEINDNYGHLAGDNILKNSAQLLSRCLKRRSDWVARFGGEEFLVCMPGSNLETALTTAENMRKSLEGSTMTFEGKSIGITASFGIFSGKITGRETVDELISYADKKMYLAKKNGRNRIEY